ncbi:MAG: class I SAM-dependent methyltransferase [Gammaproteobacteria bacterium]
MNMQNADTKTVAGFGAEWARFDQRALTEAQLREQFDRYFGIFPWDALPDAAVGFDMGCGSGRWAKLAARKVRHLYCIDASEAALEVARNNLEARSNCTVLHASFDSIPLDDGSMDFGYSLGVLHHIPDALSGMEACTRKLKAGAPFLVYIDYAFDNRPAWFQMLWKGSDVGRRLIARLPFRARYWVSQTIAASVYYPLARSALLLGKFGINTESLPLSAYKTLPFYSMRTDALDRFGTALEKRFTKVEIQKMMEQAGLESITFSDSVPYWCAVGYKKATTF